VADEIKIENVGGESGVASEVTLARLVTAMEKMAKANGGDGQGQAAKTQKAYNDAQKEGIKVSTKHRDAVKDNTDAVQENTKYLNLMGGGLMRLAMNGIGAAVGSLKGFAEELLHGGDTLSSFAQHVPIVGSALTMFTGIIDNSYSNFKMMAASGADFGYSLADLRQTAADARLPLEEFSSMVANNSKMLAAFGGNVTQGARQVAQMTDNLGGETLVQLQAMGLSMEQINEQMSLSAYLNRAGSRAEVQDRAAQAEAAASLTKNMLTLSKLTGEDIKTQQDKIAQAQMDLAFQMELARMDKDERDKMNALMTDAMAQGGQVAVDALKAEFLGMPPITRDLQLYNATQSESAAILRNQLGQALDESVTLEQFRSTQGDRIADYLESQVRSAGNLENLLQAAAAGAEGVPSEIANLFSGNQELLSRYFRDTGEGLIFARDAFMEDYEAGRVTPPDDGELNAMGEFLTAVGEAKKALMENFINPLVSVLTPVLNEFTSWFQGFVGEEGEGSKFQTALTTFKEFLVGTDGSGGAAGAVKDFLEAFAEDPKQAIADAFADISAALSPHLEALGTTLMNGVFTAIKDGFTALFSDPLVIAGLVAAITGLFGARAVVSALAAGATSLAGRLMPGRTPTTGTGTSAAGTTGRMGAAKGILRRLGPLGLLLGAYEIGSTLTDDTLTREEKQQSVAETGGGMAGAAAGAAAGALAGSVVPIVGTAIGGLLGGALGWWGGSAAGGAINESLTADGATPEQAQVAEQLGISEDAVANLEKLSGIGAGMERVAGAFERINALENFKDNIEVFENGLDTTALSQYNRNMQELARALEDMNDALAETNSGGLFGGGSGVAAADVIKNMGSGMGEEVANQLNTRLETMNTLLSEIRDINRQHRNLTREMVD